MRFSIKPLIYSVPKHVSCTCDKYWLGICNDIYMLFSMKPLMFYVSKQATYGINMYSITVILILVLPTFDIHTIVLFCFNINLYYYSITLSQVSRKQHYITLAQPGIGIPSHQRETMFCNQFNIVISIKLVVE